MWCLPFLTMPIRWTINFGHFVQKNIWWILFLFFEFKSGWQLLGGFYFKYFIHLKVLIKRRFYILFRFYYKIRDKTRSFFHLIKKEKERETRKMNSFVFIRKKKKKNKLVCYYIISIYVFNIFFSTIWIVWLNSQFFGKNRCLANKTILWTLIGICLYFILYFTISFFKI